MIGNKPQATQPDGNLCDVEAGFFLPGAVGKQKEKFPVYPGIFSPGDEPDDFFFSFDFWFDLRFYHILFKEEDDDQQYCFCHVFLLIGGNRATSEKCGESRPEWGRMEKYAWQEECQSAAVAHRAAGKSLALRIHPTGAKRMGWRGCHRFGDMAILLLITLEGVGAKIEGKENPALATEMP